MKVILADLKLDYKKALKHISYDDAKKLIQDEMDYYESELDHLEELYQKIRSDQYKKSEKVKVEFEPIIIGSEGKDMDEVLDEVYKKIKYFADKKVLSVHKITTVKL